MKRATFGPPAVVTTCIDPLGSTVKTARRLAGELGIPCVPRGSLTVRRVLAAAAAGDALVVGRNSLEVRGQSGIYSFHPSMAALRVLRLERGGSDPLTTAGELRPGDRFLDCTLGLGSDAIVASYAVGPSGRVRGLESCGLLAVVAREGLARYSHDDAELVSAMRRIVVAWDDALDYLAGCPASSYDVVYFDPLFGAPQSGASYLDALRRIADPGAVTREMVAQAARVAARRVVMKVARADRACRDLGHEMGFDIAHESGSSKVVYLSMEARSTPLAAPRAVSDAAPRTAPAAAPPRSCRNWADRGEGEPPPLAAVVGPTAVGKTQTASRVALLLNAEIVSADSMQVYRGMDIGTAKPRPEEMLGVPHHLIDVVDPTCDFSVALYRNLALEAISGILGRGRLPILVGGTGLYLKAVIGDLALPGLGPDPELRERLRGAAAGPGSGSAGLWSRLAQLDPEAARTIHPNDTKRIIRALEVSLTGGGPPSLLKRAPASPAPGFRLAIVGLTCPRAELYSRIEARVDQMMASGLVDEVAFLMRRGMLAGLTARYALGYREVCAYLRGLCTLPEAVRLIKRNTRRYAKRQMTWFRADGRIVWLDTARFATKEQVAGEIARIVEGKLASR